jgi:hypothetical protein
MSWSMSPGVRKAALSVHVISSVGWIGAVVAYLALGISSIVSPDTQIVRAAWAAMDVVGWWSVVPLAILALGTGLIMSLGTAWGLVRHYWVLISFVLTVVCTAVLLEHMPSISRIAGRAQEMDAAQLRALRGDLMHPGVGLAILVVIAVLNVVKPAGVTPYGWRKQRDQRRSVNSATLSCRP